MVDELLERADAQEVDELLPQPDRGGAETPCESVTGPKMARLK